MVSIFALVQCTVFTDNFSHYHKSRQTWHHPKDKYVKKMQEHAAYLQKKEEYLEKRQNNDIWLNGELIPPPTEIPEPTPGDDYQCQSCNGACDPRSPYRDFSLTASTAIATILCEAKEIPGLALPKLDRNGFETAEVTPFKMFGRSCSLGACMIRRTAPNAATTFVHKCGWDARFSELPMAEYSRADVRTGEETTEEMRLCPLEATDDKFVWKDWVKVARPTRNDDPSAGDDDGTYGDNGVSMQDEWLPVCGTRKQFMFFLKKKFEVFMEHCWRLKMDRRAKLREIRTYLHRPAVNPNVPESTKDVIFLQGDFSSVIHSVRTHDITCSHPEPHNCNVMHATYGPSITTTDSIGQDHPKTAQRLQKQGVDQVVRCENTVFFAMSKQKGSAAYDHTVIQDIVSIMKRGSLHEMSKGEAFLDRKRLPGGLREENDELPEELEDWAGPPAALFPNAKAIHRRRDGCAAQYQGKSAFRAAQTFKARNQIDFYDMRCVEAHGKCTCDGLTHALKGNVLRAADDDYGPGTKGLVRHLAMKHPSPRTSKHTRHMKPLNDRSGGADGVFAVNRYVYMYYGEDAFDDDIVLASKGYDGSSKDFFYGSHGTSINDSELIRRRQTCTCQPCLERRHDDCILSDIFGRINKPTKVLIPRPIIAPVQAETRGGETLEDYCSKLVRGQNVVVRISAVEKDEYPELEYFVARLVDKPHKLTRGGVYGTNRFNAGWYVARIQWFEKTDVDGRGNHWYVLSGSQQTMQCNAFIRSIRPPITLSYVRNKKLYKLERALNETIEKYGTFTT
jgi:hypothetical protein